jgi:serine/threonine protein kinase
MQGLCTLVIVSVLMTCLLTLSQEHTELNSLHRAQSVPSNQDLEWQSNLPQVERVPGQHVRRLGVGAFASVYLLAMREPAQNAKPPQAVNTSHPRVTARKVVQLKPRNVAAFRELLREYVRARSAPDTPLLIRPLGHWLERVCAGHGRRKHLQYVQEMPAVLGGTLRGIIQQQARHATAMAAAAAATVKNPSTGGDATPTTAAEAAAAASARARALPQRDVVRVLAQLLGLTRLLHNAGLVHRDLKPSNLLVSATARSPVVHVCDWGGATRVGQLFSAACPDDIVCTARYAAPEVIDPRCRELPAHPSQDM